MADNKKPLTEKEKREIAMLQSQAEMYKRTQKLREERDAKKNRPIATNEEIATSFEDTTVRLNTYKTKAGEEAVERAIAEQRPQLDKTDRVDDIMSIKDQANQDVDDVRIQEIPDVAMSDEDRDNLQYDVINLPSDGECYPSKIKKLAVAFLTAFDENIITSPNLYEDNLVMDFLLKNKVVDKNFDVRNLVAGDADAIVLWLRITGYGPEMPVTVTDPEGREFGYTVDLSKLKYKKFKLKGDKEGLFDFETPLSHDQIKFRFLTRGDERKLESLYNVDNTNAQKLVVVDHLNKIKNILAESTDIDNLNDAERIDLYNRLQMWVDRTKDGITAPYGHLITNRMEMNIVEVNGNRDRDFIHKYVMRMRSLDSLSFRKYVLDNEPGVNFEVEVERPASLGGGSFTTFLPWNDTVFLHIA